MNLKKSVRDSAHRKIACSLLKLEDDVNDEVCELVNGVELSLEESEDTIHAYLFTAVKNNNGTGLLLLSDIFGFEDSFTRDFAYRVACNGYKYAPYLNVLASTYHFLMGETQNTLINFEPFVTPSITFYI